MRSLTQKGAMFGLDARIALAIFGGLSIVTGAVLYGSIGQTKTVRMVADMDNLAKAFTQYQLDTGTTPIDNSIVPLKNPSTVPAGWNGPYFHGDTNGAFGILHSGLFIRPHIAAEDVWSATITDLPPVCGSIRATNCYMWSLMRGDVVVGTNIPFETFDLIDELVDGGDGYVTGNFRVRVRAGQHLGYLKGPKTF